MGFFGGYDDDDIERELGAPQTTSTNEDPDIEEMMSEAEKRFSKAQYYRALLTESIFNDDNSPVAQVVVAEIRSFVRNRLAVLLGVVSETPVKKPESVFSDEEIKALKAVAAKLAKKPELVSTPSLAPIQESPKPSVKQAKSPSTRVQPHAAKPAVVKTKGTKLTGEVLHIDGVEYREANDKRGKHWVNEAGQKFLINKNEAGQYYLKNVTPPTLPEKTQRLAQPNFNQMMALASQQLSSIMSTDKLAGVVAGDSLNKPQGE